MNLKRRDDDSVKFNPIAPETLPMLDLITGGERKMNKEDLFAEIKKILQELRRIDTESVVRTAVERLNRLIDLLILMVKERKSNIEEMNLWSQKIESFSHREILEEKGFKKIGVSWTEKGEQKFTPFNTGAKPKTWCFGVGGRTFITDHFSVTWVNDGKKDKKDRINDPEEIGLEGYEYLPWPLG